MAEAAATALGPPRRASFRDWIAVLGAVRVSIVAVTDRPGRSLPARGLSLSSRILTGTRWTILVKLPVAFSGGSRLNWLPLPGAMLTTVPPISVPGKLSISIATCSPGTMRPSCVSL